jgi:hypothetical protein
VTAFRRHLSLHRGLAAWLFAFALAVRLLVPAGYMPMAGKAGLEICAGQNADLAAMASMPGMGAMPLHAAMPMPMHGMDHGKAMPGDHDHDCGFAAAVGGAADLPVLILPAMLAPVALPVAFVAQGIMRPGLGLAAPPPPKTGPPSILR